jgi:hypothetical protein
MGPSQLSAAVAAGLAIAVSAGTAGAEPFRIEKEWARRDAAETRTIEKSAEASGGAVRTAQTPEEGQEEAATKKFAGLSLGAGLSVSFDLGDADRIDDAAIVNGVVRVNDVDDASARLLLESHYLFLPDRPFLGLVEPGLWGWGPFAAVQAGEGEVIKAGAVGLMLGFRRNLKDTASFNLGLGMIVDPDVKTLGDGFVANRPPPPGETEVRYKERAKSGVVVVSSFSF